MQFQVARNGELIGTNSKGDGEGFKGFIQDMCRDYAILFCIYLKSQKGFFIGKIFILTIYFIFFLL